MLPKKVGLYIAVASKKIAAFSKKPVSYFYFLFSLGWLFITTSYWAILGANTHSYNADQLINRFLFADIHSLHNALIPAAHTFLIKWPLFLLINPLGGNDNSLIFLTLVSVLLTVFLFVLILSKIEKRPVVLGTILLLFSSCLMLIPAVPHSGALLPVNMAMLSTRNLEYVIFILCTMLFIKYPRVKSWQFIAGCIVLSLLFASDKLFIAIAVGSGMLALITYSLIKGWNLVNPIVRWLLASIVAAVSSILILHFIDVFGVANIVSSGASPYGLITNFHQLFLGAGYSVLSVLTNLGANPAFGETVFSKLPSAVAHGLFSVKGPSYLINATVLIAGIYSFYQLVKTSLDANKDVGRNIDRPTILALLMFWSAAASLVVYIFSNHYYADDQRYLSIILFSCFIAITNNIRKWNLRNDILILSGVVICLATVLAMPSVNKLRNAQNAAQIDVKSKDALISTALSHHPVKYLVGDYWRVVPQRFNNDKIQVIPLQDCTNYKGSLMPRNWNVDLDKHSFAYLLSLKGSATDFPRCSIDDVVKAFGRPNASLVVAGKLSNPSEILLFYDKGAHHSAPVSKQPASGPATILPVEIDDLPAPSCSSPTIMNIVAHEDDDLLFMNPDTIHDIRAGHCIRTVYMTAGDSGGDKFYWIGREQGSMAAYSQMTGIDNIWIQRIVKLDSSHYVTIANPQGNKKISLVFLHLPDGNVNGSGFPGHKSQSLFNLHNGYQKSITSVDEESTYSHEQLVAALNQLMQFFQPSEIRTQAQQSSRTFPDHSDHLTTSAFTDEAYGLYEQKQFENKVAIPISHYIGYPIHADPPNVLGDDLRAKEAAFEAYSSKDPATCQTLDQCYGRTVYGVYLTRQYKL